MKLNDLYPSEGSRKKKTRVGRGISAGKGKTAGKGTKGQNSRSGVGGNLYRQGGNLPLYRRLPFKRGEGFTPINRVEFNEVNISQLAKFEAKTEVTPELLAAANMLHKNNNPVVILGRGDITVPLTVKVHRVSKSAQEKIQAAGGTIELIAL